MRLRNAILLGVLLLIVVMILATIGASSVTLRSAAFQEVSQSLETNRRVFEEILSYRQSLLRAQTRVIANEPRLKAVVATEEVSQETILDVSLELQKTAASQLFLMTDGQGQLLIDVAAPEASGADLSQNLLIKEALDKGEDAGVWLTEDSIYQVQAKRLSFGETTVGVLVTGYQLDARVVAAFSRQTNGAVVVERAGRGVVASPFNGKLLTPAGLSFPELVTPGEPAEVVIDQERYLAKAFPLPQYKGQENVRYVVLSSLDRALAPSQQVSLLLYGIGFGALLAAILLASILARKLSRPIDALVSFTQQIAAGDLSVRAPLQGPREIIALSSSMNRMVSELETSRASLSHKERLERELEIATRIQTSILPKKLEAPNLQVSAMMLPANEVGGDYYDLLPTPDGCWLGIGDVAGHGLTAGLVMLMIQSTVSALVRRSPTASPRELVCVLNAVLYENIRQRLNQDEHVTFSLFRYESRGKLVFAGAHEEILLYRAKSGRCEHLSTPGTWLGAMPEIDRFTSDTTCQLEPGDLVLIYTDGLTEARSPKGEQLGLERVAAELQALSSRPVQEIREQLYQLFLSWTERAEKADDVTLVVLRYQPAEET